MIIQHGVHIVFLLDETRQGKDQPRGVEVPEPARAREEPDNGLPEEIQKNTQSTPIRRCRDIPTTNH